MHARAGLLRLAGVEGLIHLQNQLLESFGLVGETAPRLRHFHELRAMRRAARLLGQAHADIGKFAKLLPSNMSCVLTSVAN